jgi:hypothetical protein
VNGLRWGMDGWVYCAGGAHTVNYNKSTSIESKITGEKIELGARDFRFKPDTGEIDPQTGPSQFGRVRDDWGHWFGVQNSKPLWHYLLQDHYLRRTPGMIPPDPVKLMYPLNPTVWATSEPEKRYHSFGHATTYTSACGIDIYRGGTLFDDNKTHAFTCEPFHNLVQHHLLEDDGVSFKARVDHDGKTHDFFASEDRWCRPVMVRDGPDGAVVQAQLKAAEERLKSLTQPTDPAAPVPSDSDARITAARTEVARLQESLRQSSQREAELQTALAQESSLRSRLQKEKIDLEKRLSDATTALKSRPQADPAPTRQLEMRLAKLERERDDLQKRLSKLTLQTRTRLAAIRPSPATTPRDQAMEFRLFRP